MCGISAVIALDTKNRDILKSEAYRKRLAHRLRKSLKAIKHRGPDARRHWISKSNRVALGHVRLAINDLSPSGNQPFHDPAREIHAVVNGELYGHDRIREELSSEYAFKGNSDCEIVIALYLKYGVHLLSKLRGEFSFCLYDERRQIFLAARDRYGVKPLFWTVQKKNLLVASEAKAFIPLGWRPEWDVRSLVEDGWLHDERTIFKGVNKIRPGHYMISYSFGHISLRQYWDMDFPDKHVLEERTETEMIEGLRQHLLDAVDDRLRADVPVGIYLSGGIDSAILAGLATYLLKQREQKPSADSNQLKQPLVCFGVGFEEKTEFDEMPIAQRTANWLGLPFISRRMDEQYLTENFEDATISCEHHNPDLNYVAKYSLSELPRESGFKVVLSGEGSDEHLGGYRHFLPDYLREPDLAWPKSALSSRKRARLAVETERASQPGYKGISQEFTSTQSTTARRMLNNTSISACLWTVTLAHFSPWTKIYGDLSIQDTRAMNPDGRVLQSINTSWHPLHTSQYVWTKSILPNLILTCMGDRMEMAHSIEGRPPFLDHRLTQFINHLPPSTKIRYDPNTGEFIEKWILREAGRPFINDEMYTRRKHPFTAPNAYPPNGPLHKLLARLITHENVEALGFLDWTKSSHLVDQAFYRGDAGALRFALVVAQWVVISKQFGVRKAEPLI